MKAGKIQFCIDQQPYLQGYLAITQLYLYKKNGNDPRRRQAVTDRPDVRRQARNIDSILPFIEKNTR